MSNTMGNWKNQLRKRTNYVWKIVFSVLSFIVLIITIINFVTQTIDKDDNLSMSGNWEVEFITEETSYEAYNGMSLVYKLYFSQSSGAKQQKVSAIGETYMANGKDLPPSRHRKFTIEGELRGDSLIARFILIGGRRESYGSIAVKLSEDESRFEGTFESTVANSFGKVIGIRK